MLIIETKDLNFQPSSFGATIIYAKGKKIVVLSDLEANTGMNITQAGERYLNDLLRRELWSLKEAEDIIFVEHIPGNRYLPCHFSHIIPSFNDIGQVTRLDWEPLSASVESAVKGVMQGHNQIPLHELRSDLLAPSEARASTN